MIKKKRIFFSWKCSNSFFFFETFSYSTGGGFWKLWEVNEVSSITDKYYKVLPRCKIFFMQNTFTLKHFHQIWNIRIVIVVCGVNVGNSEDENVIRRQFIRVITIFPSLNVILFYSNQWSYLGCQISDSAIVQIFTTWPCLSCLWR